MPNRKFISIVDKATAINNNKNGKERKIVAEGCWIVYYCRMDER